MSDGPAGTRDRMEEELGVVIQSAPYEEKMLR